MTFWRPPQEIRVKALAIARRKDAFLFAEVLSDDGGLKGLRPLGGSIEFGESRETALLRELKEELGVGARIVGAWEVFENIYRHEGALGHEIIFAAEVIFDVEPGGGAARFVFSEASGSSFARWATLEEVERAGLGIYPLGIADRLRRALPAL